MTDGALTPNQMIHGENLYAQAIDAVLAKAQHRVLIFDQDLSYGDFASRARYELLKNFLSNNIASELNIVLHYADYFQQKCPHLLNLLRIYAHKVTLHLTDNTMKNFKSCFIVVDGEHYIKRIHIDQARFKFSCDDKLNSEVLHQQFLELLSAAPDRLSTITLGL